MEDDRSAVLDEDRRKKNADEDPAEQGSDGMQNRDQPKEPRHVPNKKLLTEETDADRGSAR